MHLHATHMVKIYTNTHHVYVMSLLFGFNWLFGVNMLRKTLTSDKQHNLDELLQTSENVLFSARPCQNRDHAA